MIGQKKLITKLSQYNIDTFPHSILFLGRKGSGRHTIANFISQNILNLPLVEITDKISSDFIDEIYRNPNPTIYFISLDDMLEKNQNILLKFVEEPLKTSFIILSATSTTTVLNTVLNRCVIFEMEEYTEDELKTFIPIEKYDERLLKIITTPGQVQKTNLTNIDELFTLCEKIVTKISAAGYFNTLSIVNKINYKDNYDKFDLTLFFNCLTYIMTEYYRKENNPWYYKMYMFTLNERKKLIDSRLNKEAFMTYFLSGLWRLSREN